ncbi:hypothetical protein PSAB6_590021 [Paraburkholderia sabiae]|nr:hypothetical protein PSAB6_590021 [Paraburkholderia sabiae]
MDRRSNPVPIIADFSGLRRFVAQGVRTSSKGYAILVFGSHSRDERWLARRSGAMTRACGDLICGLVVAADKCLSVRTTVLALDAHELTHAWGGRGGSRHVTSDESVIWRLVRSASEHRPQQAQPHARPRQVGRAGCGVPHGRVQGHVVGPGDSFVAGVSDDNIVSLPNAAGYCAAYAKPRRDGLLRPEYKLARSLLSALCLPESSSA